MSETLAATVQALTIAVTATKEQVDRMALVILGDPTDETKPGVMIRLDRLERSNQIRNKVTWILATGMLIAAGNALLTLIQ